MRIGVGAVEGGFEAQVAAPNGFSSQSGRGEEAGAAEEVDGELAEGTRGGDGRALVGR